MSIPFIDLKSQYARIKDDIAEAINGVLDHGQYILGPAVKEFEADIVNFTGASECISVASGTDALVIPLMAKGIGPGDAVFLPAFTYTATAEVAALVGATPVFVDVDADTFNMDPASLEAEIARVSAEGKLTPRIVMPVDLFGLPADYDTLLPIAEAHGVDVIADAAQSFGGSYKGKRVGALAPVSGTSFFPAKPLGCYGDGGAIMTMDDELANIMRSVRIHGTGDHKYDVVRIGMNGRLDTIQAAILSVKLKIFEEELKVKEALSRNYDRELSGHVAVPRRVDGSESAWAQYVIKVPEDARENLQNALKAKGCPTQIYYPTPMHFQKAYAHWGKGAGSMPVSEALCNSVLALPMHAYLTDESFETICTTIHQFFGRNSI